MSNVQEMPELLGFVELTQTTQVMHKDEAKWLMDALNQSLEDAVAKSVRYRKQSTINLSIKLCPGQMNQMGIEVTLNTVEPKPDILPTMAFTDNRGRLFGDDPQQTRLPLNKTVDMKRGND